MPLGAFSVIVLLGEHGLDVNLEIMTVGLAECSSSLLLAENVIVGDVPEFIIQNAGSIDFSTIKELP